MIPISDILIRSISGYVFMVPVFVLYFLWLKKLGRTQSFLHTAAVFVFGYYLFGLLTVTGIGFTSTMTFRPNISWTPFIGMITGPIDTILNIILFVPLGFFLPLLYKKYHHMKTVALTGFLFSLAVEIVQMFGWGSSDINDLMTNTAGACIGFLVYCLLSRILPANLKKQLQSSRVNAVAEVLLFAICTFAIMVTAQTWFVHDVLNNSFASSFLFWYISIISYYRLFVCSKFYSPVLSCTAHAAPQPHKHAKRRVFWLFRIRVPRVASAPHRADLGGYCE